MLFGMYLFFDYFSRACDIGNVEALIKMGIGYLYNEGGMLLK